MEDDDPRWFIAGGRRWRKSDPAIPEALRTELVAELMAARRAVHAARKAGDLRAEQAARRRVQDAKVALGERGRAWWLPGDESATEERLAACMRALLRKRGSDRTICPSDAARAAAPANWRSAMELARKVALRLEDEGWLEVLQRGQPAERPLQGPLRLRKTKQEGSPT